MMIDNFFPFNFMTRIAIRKTILTLFLVYISFTCISAEPNINAQIDALLDNAALKGGMFGIVIEPLVDGNRIYSRNENNLFLPASNMKIITTAAAIELLGLDYKFETLLCYSGAINDKGVLKGDIWLLGGGDPTFSTYDIDKLAGAVRKCGIRKINGRIMADETHFDSVRLGPGWSWDDETYYYSAQISGLSVNGNCIKISIRPGHKIGSPAKIFLTPHTKYVSIKNFAKTSSAGSSNKIIIHRIRGTNTITIKGSIPISNESNIDETLTVESPALYAAQLLKEFLERKGVYSIGKTGVGIMPAEAKLITSHQSASLSEIIFLINKKSDNMMAEMLIKSLGAVINGEGTWKSGSKVLGDFIKTASPESDTFSVADGSGLSRLNLISPEIIVKVLKRAASSPYADLFRRSLPVSGIDGTLANRMHPIRGRVYAKTGYLIHVSSLSGYFIADSGQEYVFSIMLNNHSCNNKKAYAVIDSIIEKLVKEL